MQPWKPKATRTLLHSEHSVAVMRLVILICRDHPKLSEQVQCIHKGPSGGQKAKHGGKVQGQIQRHWRCSVRLRGVAQSLSPQPVEPQSKRNISIHTKGKDQHLRAVPRPPHRCHETCVVHTCARDLPYQHHVHKDGQPPATAHKQVTSRSWTRMEADSPQSLQAEHSLISADFSLETPTGTPDPRNAR